jgi:hypothetical protein
LLSRLFTASLLPCLAFFLKKKAMSTTWAEIPVCVCLLFYFSHDDDEIILRWLSGSPVGLIARFMRLSSLSF